MLRVPQISRDLSRQSNGDPGAPVHLSYPFADEQIEGPDDGPDGVETPG